MGDILQADLEQIRSLGTQLSSKAGEITGIAEPARAAVQSVDMPGADLGELLDRICSSLESTLNSHGQAVQSMSDAAAVAATTYEAMEDAFRGQLASLTDGLPR